MAYKTETLLEQAITAIEDDKLHFITDVIAAMPCSIPTFYDHFPTESKQFKQLKDLIDRNAIRLKTKLRNKWEESDNATLQLALYKLTGTEEERKRLSQSYQDHTTGGEKINDMKLSEDQINKILDKL